MNSAVLERPASTHAPRTLPRRSHLDWLESEAIHILRELAGECANPVLFFSGGKDSIVLLRLAEKAFRPGRFPFPLLHIDTGHNYFEVIEFRDRRAAQTLQDPDLDLLAAESAKAVVAGAERREVFAGQSCDQIDMQMRIRLLSQPA